MFYSIYFVYKNIDELNFSFDSLINRLFLWIEWFQSRSRNVFFDEKKKRYVYKSVFIKIYLKFRKWKSIYSIILIIINIYS